MSERTRADHRGAAVSERTPVRGLGMAESGLPGPVVPQRHPTRRPRPGRHDRSGG
ncbi:hypothetical protein JMF97_06400 [Micromonospora fiedleri]|uniref:Uncharacterized protein n=1 Tax=Micromonospora fiedleri TaxID=1157498 RepID=A0ABS1UHH1_9ACTN|nr:MULTISPECIES: hypothetical protein [Micromonospora]MBL6275788.1 hypothetical protein [Micromonospora fiedleri]WSK41899.1 hypothetical protein OG712_25965 [Micromonospora maris]